MESRKKCGSVGLVLGEVHYPSGLHVLRTFVQCGGGFGSTPIHSFAYLPTTRKALSSISRYGWKKSPCPYRNLSVAFFSLAELSPQVPLSTVLLGLGYFDIDADRGSQPRYLRKIAPRYIPRLKYRDWSACRACVRVCVDERADPG